MYGFVRSMFTEQMRLHAVYFTQWNQPEPTDSISNVGNVYPRLVDNSSSTCEYIPGDEFINVVWGLPDGETINRFRVYMNGSQQCHDANVVWFLSADKLGSKVAQCNVTQQNNDDLHVCNIQCLCPCGVQCNYLRLHVQFPPWVKRTLALCSYEQLFEYQI